MKKTTLKTLAMPFVVATALGVGALVSQPTNASALNIPANLTKIADGRFAGQTVTYHINSTSNYYHGMWSNAVKAWAKNGTLKFKEVAKSDNPQLTLSSRANKGKYEGYVVYAHSGHIGNLTSSLGPSLVVINRDIVRDYGFHISNRTRVAETGLGKALGFKYSNSDNGIMSISGLGYNSITKTDLHNLAALYK